MIATSPFQGWLQDRLGRRPTCALAAISIVSKVSSLPCVVCIVTHDRTCPSQLVGALVGAFAKSEAELLVGRALAGPGGSLAISSSSVLAGEILHPRLRAVGTSGVMVSPYPSPPTSSLFSRCHADDFLRGIRGRGVGRFWSSCRRLDQLLVLEASYGRRDLTVTFVFRPGRLTSLSRSFFKSLVQSWCSPGCLSSLNLLVSADFDCLVSSTSCKADSAVHRRRLAHCTRQARRRSQDACSSPRQRGYE